MRLRWPWSSEERAKKAYRLFCERPVGGNGLEMLQAISGQLKAMDDHLKKLRSQKPRTSKESRRQVAGD